ncbi:cell wall-binding repeat-containing protein [Desulfosporosinus meridiei]|uniref:Cell wall-binding protein n=1 Tax=Desulfosporosinus meridiei (strain ATCC BAA-275 / DSM 13257 / KCTC 12902 / NCIMB 13706 / S10) TaxID=768704 RepID=J7IWL6_DESMD|nr:cell wall-binding repeat-containing protein [Desulfosporosinus meridiei]AFQ46125.1 cell wall-binding protein [Desulfosporosinus meridiei DSM 13257]
MRKITKIIASLVIVGMALTLTPFNSFANGLIPTRLAGVSAEQTAVAIADQTGYTGTAILASSTSYGTVDALTAGPLAASLQAPILLTGAGDILDAVTKAELTKLEVKTIYVTSGTAVIKQGVIDELKGMGIEVVALGGFDRAETSVNIAKKMTGVTKVAVANTVVDALSIAAVASAANEPILLTDKDALPAGVAAYLAANASITASDVIGGSAVISDEVKTGLPDATRHAGMTAYDTNNQIIQDFAAALAFDNIYVANGLTGIDALAGAPLAAQTKSPILLTDGSTVPAVAAFIYSKNSSAVVTALGGTAVVPESVRVGVSTGNVSKPVELAIVSVTALDDSNRFIEIFFSKPITGLQASDIVILNADTLDRYGVSSVQMSANGLTATIELYAGSNTEAVLKYAQDYNFTVKANGIILKAIFNRAYSNKVRVQDFNVRDKEITAYDDKTGKKFTLKIPDSLNFDYQAALGELVQVWYDGDNELTNYKITSFISKTDAIKVAKANQIELLSEKKIYYVSKENYFNTNNQKFDFYLNGQKADIADQLNKKFNFAKIVFDKYGNIVFVSAYSLKDVLIVDSVDESEVTGVDGPASVGSFDATNASIIKGGKVISLADLKKGDLLFFNDDADNGDGYAEVLNNQAVSGEINTVYVDSIEVNGEIYDFDYDDDVAADFDYTQQAVYLDEDGDVTDVDSDAAKELQAAGEVELYTDYAGNLIFIDGEVDNLGSYVKIAALTEDILGYTTARDRVEIKALTQNEEKLSFDIDLESLDKITVDGIKYAINNRGSKDWTASLISGNTGIKLKDNTTVKADVNILFNNEADAGSLVKLHLDDEDNLLEIDFFSGNAHEIGCDTITGADSLRGGDKYLRGYKLTPSTLMFDATEGHEDTDADDYIISTFGDYKGSKIISGNFIYNANLEIMAVWYDAVDTSDVIYEEAVATDILRNTKQEIVSVTAYADGKLQTFSADKITGFETSSGLAKGDVIILGLDRNNNMLIRGFATAGSDIISDGTEEYAARVITDLTVASVDFGNKTVKFSNGDTYRLADKGLVLDGVDNNDITIKSLSDLRGKTNVTIVMDEKSILFVKFFIIEPVN